MRELVSDSSVELPGAWDVEARVLLTLPHEFPDRLQHHDHLPGEETPLFRTSTLSSPPRTVAASAKRPSPARRDPEPREKAGLASPVPRSGWRRGFAAVGAPTEHLCPDFSVLLWKGSPGLSAESWCHKRGTVPKVPRGFRTAPLAQELEKSAVLGAGRARASEC